MQSPSRISLSVSLIRGLESAGGAVCSCGVLLVRGSAGVWGVACCARLTVAATSVVKASAVRFTVHLLLQTADETPPFLRHVLTTTPRLEPTQPKAHARLWFNSRSGLSVTIN